MDPDRPVQSPHTAPRSGRVDPDRPVQSPHTAPRSGRVDPDAGPAPHTAPRSERVDPDRPVQTGIARGCTAANGGSADRLTSPQTIVQLHTRRNI